MLKTQSILPALIFFLTATQISFPALKSLHYECTKTINIQESDFSGTYVAKRKTAFMYKNPDSKSKTDVKLDESTFLSVTKKSGNFVFGTFRVSDEERESGWFRLKDLEKIKFIPPKVVKRSEIEK